MENFRGTHERPNPLLVVTPSVPIARESSGYVIDEKAVAGLEYYLKLWPGSVRAIFREGERSALQFGKVYAPTALPFEICCLGEGATIPDELIAGASVVLAS